MNNDPRINAALTKLLAPFTDVLYNTYEYVRGIMVHNYTYINDVSSPYLYFEFKRLLSQQKAKEILLWLYANEEMYGIQNVQCKTISAFSEEDTIVSFGIVIPDIKAFNKFRFFLYENIKNTGMMITNVIFNNQCVDDFTE